ncbi:hypothetical protein [Tabrizicola sp.]|uniref:hypothetical protein n=1 Tax=Tabrizicola sp. TaxID=2005166 RepID=UPI002FDE566B
MAGLWVMAGAMVVFAGVIAYAMTRRYGWGAALALPVLALVVMIAMQWQDRGLDAAEGLRMAGSTLLFALPMLLGFFAGMAVAWFRRA